MTQKTDYLQYLTINIREHKINGYGQKQDGKYKYRPFTPYIGPQEVDIFWELVSHAPTLRSAPVILCVLV